MVGMTPHRRNGVYFVALTTASYLALAAAASAQSSTPSSSAPPNNSTLPPVVVQSPQQRQAKPAQSSTQTAPRARAASRRNANPRNVVQPAPGSSSTAPRTETAYSHVDGYVATRSATGTKTDTPLIETPQSISVVTRDQIEAQNAQSAKEALRYTAGVSGENRGNFGGFDIMYNRGFILDQYLDGMRLPGSSATFPPQPEMYGIERVELLRGPASILFGQGSPGGIVNLVSKRPSEISSNEVLLQGGTFDRIQGGFDSTGKLDKNGEFLYRITGFAKDADNQVDHVKDQRYFIAPSLTWRPTKDTTWTVMASYQNDPSVGYYNFVPYAGSLGFNPNGKIPTSFYAGDTNFNKIARESASVTSLFEHHFSDAVTFRQNTRYGVTSGELNQVFPLLLDTDYNTLYRYAETRRERIGSLTTDNQFEFKFDTGWLNHKVLVGVDTQYVTLSQLDAQSSQVGCLLDPSLPCSADSAPPISVFSPSYGTSPILNPLNDPNSFSNTDTRQTLQQTGIYAQDQIKIGKLTVVGGLRYDTATNKTGTTDFVFGGSDSVKHTDTATTGRIGAIYDLGAGFAPYVNYATSFNPNVGTTSAFAPLKPTTGEMIEGGIKYQPTWFKGFVQLSVFDQTQQNMLTIDPNNSLFRSQIGEVHSQGVEIEGKASITNSLDIIASYTHLNPKVTKSLQDDLGKRPVWIPNDIAGAWADYTFRGGALNGFGAAFGVRYTGQTWGDTANTALNVPSYTLFDAALHYELENLDPRLKGARLQVNATNLFDKTYVSQCVQQAVDPACVYGLRRQVIATLRYRW